MPEEKKKKQENAVGLKQNKKMATGPCRGTTCPGGVPVLSG